MARSLTRSDRKDLGAEFEMVEEMLPGAPPPDPLPPSPEDEFAIVEPAPAPSPPPALPTEQEIDDLKALLAKKRTRRGELVDEQAAVEDRLSLVAEQLAVAQQEARRRRHDQLIEPSEAREGAALEARETVKRLYEEESELLDSKSAFSPAADDLDRQIVQLARQIDSAKVARVKEKLEAGRAHRSDVLLQAMSEALVLWELTGALAPAPLDFGPLLNITIGHDKSITEAARLLRAQEGLL